MWNFILPRKSKTSEKEVERLALSEIKSYYGATLIRQQSFGPQIDKLTNGPKQRSRKHLFYMETWYMAKLLLKISAKGRASSINVDMTFGSPNTKRIIQDSYLTATN